MIRDDLVDAALEMVWRQMARVNSSSPWCKFELCAMPIPSGVIWWVSGCDETVFVPDAEESAP